MAITIDGTNGLSSDNAALKLDGTTLAVDETNNRVGVGTASPAVAMDVVGQVRASTGILFGSDTAAANALDDYEEGTWTPTDASGAGLSFSGVTSARYTKIGNKVFVDAEIQFPSTASGAVIRIGSLPFTSEAVGTYGIGPGMNNANLNAWVFVNQNATNFDVYVTSSNFTQATNAQFSTKILYCSVAYTTA